MRDIPFFTTDNGVASIALQQIPYTGRANITILSSDNFLPFLVECVAFCKMAGAEAVYASGDDRLSCFPIYTQIWKMQMPIPQDVMAASLFPVTQDHLRSWLEIYNRGMKAVRNAAYLDKSSGSRLLNDGTAYFVHKDGVLLGIGIVSGDTVQAIVSCKKGAGAAVMNTLCGCVTGDTVFVQVAAENVPAVKLYERMGFIRCGIASIWYDVTAVK